MRKIIGICTIVVIAIVLVWFLGSKIADLRKEKPECKIIDGEEVCGKEIETEKGTEKIYTTEDGEVQVTERYDKEGNLKQTERKVISEYRECIEVREPGESMPMMAGCRPRNQ